MGLVVGGGGGAAAEFVPPNLQILLDATEFTPGTGSNIASLTDLSGNGNSPSEGTAGSQPVWVRSAFGGGPGALFDDVAAKRLLLATSGRLSFERTQPLYWYAVFSTTSAGNAGIVFKGSTSGAQCQYLSHTSANLGQIALMNVGANGVIVTWPMSKNVPHAVLVEYDGSSTAAGLVVNMDGSDQVLTIVQNNLSATILNGNRFGVGSMNVDATALNPWKGHLQAFGLGAGTLTARERQKLVQQINARRNFA